MLRRKIQDEEKGNFRVDSEIQLKIFYEIGKKIEKILEAESSN